MAATHAFDARGMSQQALEAPPMPLAINQSDETGTCIDHALHEDPTETTLLPLRKQLAEENESNPPPKQDRTNTERAAEPPSGTSGDTLT